MPHEKFLRDNWEYILTLSKLKSEKGKEIISGIKDYVENACKELTTHQLRQMYSEIKNAKEPINLQLARPKIAYLGARQEKGSVKNVILLVDFFMEKVDTSEQLEEFKNFMEAVVAYHKFHFGNKNQ